MDTSFFSTVAAHYQGWLAFVMFVCVLGIPKIISLILCKVGVFKEISQLNKTAAAQKSTKERWVKNQAWNRKWGSLFLAVIYICIIPFVITAESQVWWKYIVDIFIILMVYDFFYYLAHRFLFHDGGPLVWVHAVHHQQKNPCRQDSSFIHPIEVALGLSLYVGTVALLSVWMGEFHIITLVLTWIAFSEINLHNHDLQTSDRFPFKYLKYMTDMHHVHHARFVGGNFATISLFYDWLFGTYDTGDGWGKHKNSAPASAQQTISKP